MGRKENAMTTKKKRLSFTWIFTHADGVDKLLMIIGFLGAVGDGISLPAMLLLSGKFLNSVGQQMTDSPTQNFSHNINKNVLLFCYLACAQWIACFLEGYCWTRTSERQASTLRARYLKAVLRQDVGYFDLNVTSTADIIESVSSDCLVIQDVISEKVPVFLMNVASFIGCNVAAFLILWRLALVGIPFVAVILVIPGIVYGRTLMVISRKIRDEYIKAGSIVEQAVSSIRTVYSFVGETKTVADYSAALEGTFKLGMRQGLAKGLVFGSTGMVYVIWSFLAYYGGRLVMYHGAKGGSVWAVVASVAVGGLSLGSSLLNVRYFSEAGAMAERIREVMERVPEIDSENMEGETLGNVSGEVEFKHVEFAYPSRPENAILRGFSLRIPAGRTVALVGESGSGKSTVIALLQRFYNPLGGEILLDGVTINKLQIQFLRSQMGLVSQEPSLFATTIKENILFGKEDATIDEVIEAAKAANAHHFISQMPQGYDTQVGERGVQMSGGQKQRIAIARAIIKAPKILLLDEATSALDSESERIVQQALDKATEGRSTIVIAHRLSTIRNADVIVVIQNGKILEIGSHDELMGEENGSYASLIRLQETRTGNQDDRLGVSSESSALNRSLYNSSSRKPSSFCQPNSDPSSNKATGKEMKKFKRTRPKSSPSFRRLLAMNLPEWRQALSGCISAVVCGAIQPTFSFGIGSMLSVYFLPDNEEIKEKIRLHAIFFASMGFFTVFINIYQHYNLATMGESLTKRVREKMLSKILTFEIGWFDKDENSTGAICSRLAQDANVVRSLVGDRMSLLIQTLSAMTTAFIMGLVISWRLAIVIIAIQPIVILSYYWRGVLLKTMSKKSMKAQEESGKIAAEAVSNLRTIAAFSSQTRILQMLEKAQQSPRLESIRQSWFAGIGLSTSNSLTTMSWAFSFWYAGKLMDNGSLEAKALFQTFMILVSTGRVIAETATMTNDIAKGSDTVESIFAVLDRCSLMEPNEQEGHKPDELTGHVELRGVDFAYPSRPDVMIFKEFSLKIEAGKSTALVGQSGSGKSTIIGLIERFYDPISGIVEIDYQDIRSYNLRALRKQIALVSQEPALFTGTVRQNITYGASVTVHEQQIIEAAKVANAHDFITGLKDGYDTWCGDKGLQLSGGQKQRIAIARAVLKNPAILLLDEATSALDSQSEKVVQDAVEKLMVGRTSVVVAHRLSTIQSCNTIVVLNEGCVVEKGTHAHLLEMGPNGVYFSLVTLHKTTSHFD